jgi:hypothetical protein
MPGDLLTPKGSLPHSHDQWDNSEHEPGEHVYTSRSPASAANAGNEHPDAAGMAHVYQVEHTGPAEPDHVYDANRGQGGINYKTRHPVRVLRRVDDWISEDPEEALRHLRGGDTRAPRPVGGLEPRQAAAEEDELPPDPGTTPIPAGHIRLWHYTPLENAGSIREHGLLNSKARGDAGNGDLTDPSAGVWASTKRPDEILNNHSAGAAVVEFHAHPSQISGNAESPWQSMNKDRTWDDSKVQDWAGGYHHVIMHGDVRPSQIAAIHEPWHGAARYMRDDDPTLASYQWIKEESEEPHNDHLLPYRRGLRALERQKRTARKTVATLAAPTSLRQVLSHAAEVATVPWLPETPGETAELLGGFPLFFGALADGLESLGGRLDDCPVDEHLPALARSMATACRTAADDAEEVNARVKASFFGGVNG